MASANSDFVPPALAASPDYEVIQEINRGGMGVVYLVRNRRMDRLEALKVVKAELLARDGALERFEREMRSAARLNHPNIVTAYSAPPLDGLVAFSMEFVEGTDLYQLVRIRGVLPVSNACYYVYQAAQALQHAHDRQMVHRDIKPNNLMLTRDGKKQVVKILDFGLAKASSEQQTDGGLTGTGQMLGTPHYIAPEQTRDASKADIRADIYSLGCTLYYLLTGEPPFHAKGSLFEILEAHHRLTPRPLNELRPDVPVELAAIVSKMMAKDPAERYQKPAEVAEALRPWFGSSIKPIPVGSATFRVPLGSASGFETVMPGDTKTGKPTGGTSPDTNQEAPGPAVTPSERNPAAPSPVAVPPAAPVARDPAPPRPVDATPIQTLLEVVTDEKLAQRGVANKQRKAPARQLSGLPVRLWAGIAAGVVAALLAAWASGVFTKVKTPEGILAIEVNEPGAEVFVDGQKVAVKWDDGGNQAEVQVTSGERQVEIKKAGFSVAGTKITFKEGDREIFRATLEPEKADRGSPTGDPLTDAKLAAHDVAKNGAADLPKLGFVPLFNGKDLTGWKTHPSQPGYWRVENGVLIGAGQDTSHLYSDREFSNFRLYAEVRVSDRGNGGIYFRTPFGPAAPAANPRWLIGYEAQIDSSGRDQNRTGSLYKNGTQLLVSIPESPVPPGQWFRLEVLAKGSHIVIKVDGQTTADYVDTQKLFSRGHIALQQHDANSVVEFRKIEIEEITDRQAAVEDVSIPALDAGTTLIEVAKPEIASRFPLQSVWVSDEGHVLIVTGRTGDTFQAILKSGDGANQKLLSGTVKGNEVSWLGRDARALKGKPAFVDHHGIITSDKSGDKISFSRWDPRTGRGSSITYRRREK